MQFDKFDKTWLQSALHDDFEKAGEEQRVSFLHGVAHLYEAWAMQTQRPEGYSEADFLARAQTCVKVSKACAAHCEEFGKPNFARSSKRLCKHCAKTHLSGCEKLVAGGKSREPKEVEEQEKAVANGTPEPTPEPEEASLALRATKKAGKTTKMQLSLGFDKRWPRNPLYDAPVVRVADSEAAADKADYKPISVGKRPPPGGFFGR